MIGCEHDKIAFSCPLHLSSVVLLPLLIIICVLTVVASDEITDIISQRFNALDSTCTELLNQPQVKMKEVAVVEGLFSTWLRRDTALIEVLRTSSKGIIVNRVLAKNDEGFSDGRDATKLPFFSQAALNSTNYYGVVDRADRKLLCWSKPIIIVTSNNKQRFGGIVAFGIDPQRVANSIAKKNHEPFQIIAESGAVLCSSRWKNRGEAAQKPLIVNNTTIAIIKYFPEKKAATATSVAATIKAVNDTDRKPPVASVDTMQPVATINPSIATPLPVDTLAKNALKRAEKKPHNNYGLIAFVFGALLIMAALLILGGMLWRSKHRKPWVLESAEDSEEPPLRSKIKIPRETRQAIVTEESQKVRNIVIAQLYVDLRKQIEKHEAKKMYAELRQKLADEMRGVIQSGEIEAIKDEVRASLRESVRESVRSDLETAILRDQKEVLESEIKEVLKHELEAALRARGLAVLEQEVLERVKENISARVHLEQGPQLHSNARSALEREVEEQVRAQELPEILEIVRRELTAQIRDEINASERTAIAAQIRSELAQEIYLTIDADEHQVIQLQQRARLEQEIESETRATQTELLRSDCLNVLRNEIRESIQKTDAARIRTEERERIRQDIVAALQANEYTALINEERLLLRQNILKRLDDSERMVLTEQLRTEMHESVRNHLRDEELGTITGHMRRELTESILLELENNERESIYKTLRQKMEQELYNELDVKERKTIRGATLLRIQAEERERIVVEDRSHIIEGEKKRILDEEGSQLRAEVRAAVSAQERQSLIEELKETVHDASIQEVRQELTEQYQIAMEDKLAALKESLALVARKDEARRMQEELRELLRYSEQVIENFNSVEALVSLRQTINLLKDEKKKFKYYNLNTTQTESLLDYLDRSISKFDIYFDRLDESGKELILKFHSLINQLRDSSSHADR